MLEASGEGKVAFWPLLAFYGRSLRKVLGGVQKGSTFVAAMAMHALGHAAIALVAAAAASALVGEPSGGPSLLQWPVVKAFFRGREPRDVALALAGFGLVAVVVKALAGVVASHLQADLTGRMGAHLRHAVLAGVLAPEGAHRVAGPRHGDHTLHTPDVAHTDDAPPRPSHPLAALTSHVRDVEQGLRHGVLGGARAIAQLVPLLAVLVFLAPGLSLSAVAVFAPFAWLVAIARRRHRRRHEAALVRAEAVLDACDDAVRNAELWTAFGARDVVLGNVRRLGDALASRAAAADALSAAMSGANEVLGAIAVVLVLAAARAGVLGGAADGAALLGFLAAFFLAYRPLRDLSEARLAVGRAEAALSRLSPWLARQPEVARDAAGEPVTPPAETMWKRAPLVVAGLRLPRGTTRTLDLVAEPGEVVAIVGPTGSGKSTFLRTLLGFEQAREGRVAYGDTPLEHAPPGPDARPFAWVPQDAPLLGDSLAANLALGARGRDVDARALLGELGAGHLVDSVGAARLGPYGRALSGGERQLLALARAFASGQPVLLLDEPTSGLDGAAQAHVLRALAAMKGQRTLLIVTHRAEPLAIADRIMRLADAPDAARWIDDAPPGGSRVPQAQASGSRLVRADAATGSATASERVGVRRGDPENWSRLDLDA